MTEKEKQKLFALANAYKEQVYEKLLDLLPERLGRIEAKDLEGLPLEEVLGPMYMQGVGEALDGFDVEALLRALEEDDTIAMQA